MFDTRRTLLGYDYGRIRGRIELRRSGGPVFECDQHGSIDHQSPHSAPRECSPELYRHQQRKNSIVSQELVTSLHEQARRVDL